MWAKIKKKNETGVKSPNTRTSGAIINETSAKSQEEIWGDAGIEVDKKSDKMRMGGEEKWTKRYALFVTIQFI